MIALLAALIVAVPHGDTARAAVDEAPIRWGARGHEIAARVAASGLPSGMPAFFRDASGQLVYLNPEPDRWRERSFPAMDQALSYDHYVNLENVPGRALEAAHRYAYLRALSDAGLERPEVDGGFLPFHMLELYQRLVTEWRRWRSESDATRRRWIEDRIVQDAGLLGHYVTDASQPHHTTIHYNGWDSDSENPERFTSDRSFHSRFESAFVDAHIRDEDVRPLVTGAARSVAGRARAAIWEHVRASHAQVETLYRLEKAHGFDPRRTPAPEAKRFAATRLASGADMLRTLWWSAWVESEGGR